MPPVLVSKGLRGRNPHEGEGKRSRVELHPGGGRHIDWAKKSLLHTALLGQDTTDPDKRDVAQAALAVAAYVGERGAERDGAIIN